MIIDDLKQLLAENNIGFKEEGNEIVIATEGDFTNNNVREWLNARRDLLDMGGYHTATGTVSKISARR